MVNIKILEEKPMTLAEVKTRLEDNKEPIPKGIKTLTYLKSIPILKEKINALGLTRLKDKHITKIIDIMPMDLDSLRIILSQDITLKQEDLQKILETLKS